MSSRSPSPIPRVQVIDDDGKEVDESSIRYRPMSKYKAKSTDQTQTTTSQPSQEEARRSRSRPQEPVVRKHEELAKRRSGSAYVSFMEYERREVEYQRSINSSRRRATVRTKTTNTTTSSEKVEVERSEESIAEEEELKSSSSPYKNRSISERRSPDQKDRDFRLSRQRFKDESKI